MVWFAGCGAGRPLGWGLLVVVIAVASTASAVEAAGGAKAVPYVAPGSAWLPDFSDKDYVALCRENFERERPLLRTANKVPRKPAFPHFDLAGHYSCKECRAIVDTMISFCRANPNAPTRSEFLPRCANSLFNMTKNTSSVFSKCTDFHNFVGDMFCPMDPCDHLTTTETHAPKAICDLARCYVDKEPVVVPPTCPVILRTIFGECTDLRKKAGSHGHPHLTAAAACKTFRPHYAREACQLVYTKATAAVLPSSVCSQATCDSMATSYEAWCEYQLGLSSTEPVHVPGWPDPVKDDCNETLGGIVVEGAEYGVNCTHINNTNNIVDAVREHCQGQTKCTVGNRDLANKTTAWNPIETDETCVPGFEIRYRCFPGGPLHIFNAPESAKYMQLPIDCTAEIARHRPVVPHASGFNQPEPHVP